MRTQTAIVFALFPGLTQLDFTGPYEVFSRLPDAMMRPASTAGYEVRADMGLTFAGLERLGEIEACEVLCVPGGPGIGDALLDDDYVAQVRRLGRTARFVVSISSGSLALGAAGLLRGRRAACDWVNRDLLASFDAIADPARVVRDGAVITAAGSTAGIDMALALAAELADVMTAQAIQLMLAYAPEPPFDAGAPDRAPPAVVRRVQMLQAQHRPKPKGPPNRRDRIG